MRFARGRDADRRAVPLLPPGPGVASGREEFVPDAVGLLALRPLLEDVDQADFGGIFPMRPATGTVVRGADLNDPQPSDGGRDEVEQRPIADLRVDDHAVFLEDAGPVGGRGRAVALVLNPFEVFCRQVPGLELDARVVRVPSVPDRPGSVDLPAEAGTDAPGSALPP